MEKPLIFISCGQSTREEAELGTAIARFIAKETPYAPYFAKEQNTLDGLVTNILGALDRAVGLIAVMHNRGTVTFPGGTLEAGIRLAMSGQVSEAFPVLRSAIESTWYALHIAKDPKGTERSEIWLRRNEDDAAKSRCKSEFTIAKVRQTHDALDANTAKELHGIYENLIDFGAHPNQFGVMTAMRRLESDKQIDFSVGILHPEPLTVLFALRMAVAVAIGALKTFQLVFPERFTLAGIDLEIEKLVAEANALFRSYAPKGNKAGSTG